MSRFGGPDFLDKLEEQYDVYDEIVSFFHKHELEEDKREWLKNNVDYNELIEYALDNNVIIRELYDHFKSLNV